ncbi:MULTISPECIES: flagellar hook-associated protein FlgL [unclassified Halomonas]|uniref:flagellar hook-associated protein FlgL n=1 Tax=unclassified Halomonas TaxID=2609666 RepID=UPI000C8DF2BE|nr:MULTISPECIES: flagellar hook-associated protein FlgL [unclassified Halomonas]MAR71759.1 flagellar hook-associated protein 3 [Halomonas sp.]
MRISTVTMYDQSVSSLNRQQSEFLHLSQQLASGKRVVNPSDDPQAASRAVAVSQAQAVTQQYTDARVSARNALSQEESVLNSASDALASATALVIQASNDTLSDADRQSIASELRGVYETLIGQANATDGNGRYLFGGYADGAEPFFDSGSGIEYVGSDKVREQQVDASRLMAVGDTGADIFTSVPSGAGYVAEQGDNSGSVTFAGPDVVDNSDTGYGKRYLVEFGGTDDAPTYSVKVEVENNSGNWVSAGAALEDQPYDPEGTSVEVGGLRLELEGAPATDDSVTFGPADTMNTNVFTTFEKVLAVLEAPADTPAKQATLHNTLNGAMRELDASLDNVLTKRASVGARLNELDVIDSVSGNRELNYAQTMSDLVDLDYNQAISEYSMRQVGMQAAQQAFIGIRDLSLFNYM